MGTPSSHQGPAYRFDELGWLQFERVCSLALELEAELADVAWLGHADRGRVALVEQPISLASHAIRLPGPVTVLVVWVPESASFASRLEGLVERVERSLSELRAWCGDQLLLLTNLDSGAAASALGEQSWMTDRC